MAGSQPCTSEQTSSSAIDRVERPSTMSISSASLHSPQSVAVHSVHGLFALGRGGEVIGVAGLGREGELVGVVGLCGSPGSAACAPAWPRSDPRMLPRMLAMPCISRSVRKLCLMPSLSFSSRLKHSEEAPTLPVCCCCATAKRPSLKYGAKVSVGGQACRSNVWRPAGSARCCNRKKRRVSGLTAVALTPAVAAKHLQLLENVPPPSRSRTPVACSKLCTPLRVASWASRRTCSLRWMSCSCRGSSRWKPGGSLNAAATTSTSGWYCTSCRAQQCTTTTPRAGPPCDGSSSAVSGSSSE
mmetsp:Transcript_18545/g.52380  ORF Transcript_18545/g.52380 Transcript_18545/m.52380 type:complete len:300 (+) Transcript_18545:240-1139(+)